VTAALSLQIDADGIAMLRLDVPGQEVNTLRAELADEFDTLIDRVQRERGLRALVLVSGKREGFIAGADLEAVRELASAAQAEALSRLMQAVTARIAALPCATVAAIHGECLGGGLELALAFDARIASDAPGTRLALPEVQLGLLPGGGGTQRLPRLVGLSAALDLLLTGRRLDASRARRIALVDEVVPRADLHEHAKSLARRLAAAGAGARRTVCARAMDRRLGRVALAHRLAACNPLGRAVVFARARAGVHARTRGLYPAPERILHVVRSGLAKGLDAGMQAEAVAFGELCMSSQSRELVDLFFASTALKKDPGVDEVAVQPRAVHRVGIVGAGLMGTGIARVSALDAGVRVTLVDRDEATARGGRDRIAADLALRVARGRMPADARAAVLARIDAGADMRELAGADLVIEAVFEDPELKRRILREVERHAGEQVVFATNTSAIAIAGIAAAGTRPAQVAGMHYFSPVERVPLLEVVAAAHTAPDTVATCVAFGRRQGKTVVVVRDGPGFYTTRILAPYMNEAVRLVSEGVAIETVDTALLDFGFPLGPLALLDEVGIDVGEKVADTLRQAFGARMQPPPAMAGSAAHGRLGRKSGRGFYRYDAPGGVRRGADDGIHRLLGAPQRARTAPAHELAERCVLQMVNEAVRCLHEGVVRSARDGDVAAVFGLGFPPFLGGPFRYADRLSAGALAARLEVLARRHGARFEAAPMLQELAARGGRFHVPRPV
jgi:3-hydroxyacyl-CoA dehydrogenase/enoyl-CoA hydratase/3-hydroxybutyryl-CoA epimerase